MPDPFKYVFIDTKRSWSIGSFHRTLSLSSDGTTLAGTTDVNTPGYPKGKVQFWDASNGTPTSSANDWASVTFSPTDPDIAAVIGARGVQLMKRDSPGAKTWNTTGSNNSSFDPSTAAAAFRSDGKIVTFLQSKANLYEFTADTFQLENYFYSTGIWSFAYRPFDSDTIVLGRDSGVVEIRSFTGRNASALLSSPSSTGTTGVTACAWSQDGNWIATGDSHGDIRLWNGGVKTNVSFVRALPTSKSGPVSSLVFIPDSSGLIILSGGYLTVWDIANAQFVLDSGLPVSAKNIALDGPRSRLAVAIDDRITLYELQIKQKKTPPKRQGKKKPSVPPELAAFDISDQVVKSKPDPFSGLYFYIYRGAWKLNTPRVFQHVVAIKALRPGFNPDSKAQDRQDFENLLTKCLTTWLSLTHDNLVPLLGVSMNFGNFPAIVTSWMINGLLSEYIKSNQEYDPMELVVGVASGVAYLHSKNITHSDIRGSSILVDELGNPRLADPGLLSVLAHSPLIKDGIMSTPYRWMAPELIRDSSEKATFATDVYSLTMTSLEIFTAGPPFRAINDALVAGQIVQNQRPDKPDDVEDTLWALWNEGWNENPARRPNMNDYLQRLEQLQ